MRWGTFGGCDMAGEHETWTLVLRFAGNPPDNTIPYGGLFILGAAEIEHRVAERCGISVEVRDAGSGAPNELRYVIAGGMRAAATCACEAVIGLLEARALSLQPGPGPTIGVELRTAAGTPLAFGQARDQRSP